MPGRGASVAGASAYARYRRLRAEHRQERVLAHLAVAGTAGSMTAGLFDWPQGLSVAVGILLLRGIYLRVKPDAVTRWRRGAAAERRTGKHLARLDPAYFHVLHDRALPGGSPHGAPPGGRPLGAPPGDSPTGGRPPGALPGGFPSGAPPGGSPSGGLPGGSPPGGRPLGALPATRPSRSLPRSLPTGSLPRGPPAGPLRGAAPGALRGSPHCGSPGGPHGRPPRANLDHLVVGLTGVYAISSRRWPPLTRLRVVDRRLWAGSRPVTRLLTAAKGAARTVAERLSDDLGQRVEVRPIIAVHGTRLPRRGIIFGGVTLRRARRTARLIQRQPAVFTTAQVAAIAAAAERILPPMIDL